MGRSYSRARRRVLGGFALHRKAPVDRVPPSGLSTQAIRSWGPPMSFIATSVSLAVTIGAAVVVLAAVVGYGYYSFVREFFEKPDAYEP
jgi:hypothetical protein